jgi:hypothetical protein
MNELLDKRLVDEAIDAYVDWREERAAHVYAKLMTRVSVAVPTFQLDVAGESCVRA